jgi:hypothetical protein
MLMPYAAAVLAERSIGAMFAASAVITAMMLVWWASPGAKAPGIDT